MLIKNLIDRINGAYITSDYLVQPEIFYYMDKVVDDINDALNANFPVFSDWAAYVAAWNIANPTTPKLNTVYDAIPDKYLRTVVALGTALYFFSNDEEGEQAAMTYSMNYRQALFNMIRDYHALVPAIYQNNEGGYIEFAYNSEINNDDLNPRGVVLDGANTRIL